MSQLNPAAEILVVEDESDLREMIAEELEDSGFRTRKAEDGMAAFDAIRQHRPDLVLCDISMPRLDGYGLLQKLRESDEELGDIPFIFLTAFADRKEVQRGLETGADDYITKPIDFDVLIARVASRLREVQRFLDRRETELVKLYKALNRTDPGENRRGPSVQATPYDNSAILAGRLFIINLSSIRMAMGPRWKAWSERVSEAALKVIGAEMGEGDRVGRNKAGDFVICFATRDGEEASETCELIRRKIEQRFLGEDAAMEWGAETHAIDLEGYSPEATEAVVDHVSDRMAALNQSIEAQHERLVREIDHSGRILLIRSQTTKGTSAPLSVARFDSATREKIRCVAGQDGNGGDLSLELDLLMLDKVAHLLAATEFSQRTLVTTDLHHSTLMEKSYRESYLAVLRQIPERCRNNLAIRLVGGAFRHCPSDADRKILVGNSKVRIVAFEGGDPSEIDITVWRAALISADYGRLSRAGVFNQALHRTLADLAHKQGGRFLVHDAPIEAVPVLAAQGTDFIAPAER